MAKTVFTGWRTVTPGECSCCGFDDDWSCDGRGAVLCGCQACAECGELSAEGFHAQGCPELEEESEGPEEEAA
jgi:hypothetical protein